MSKRRCVVGLGVALVVLTLSNALTDRLGAGVVGGPKLDVFTIKAGETVVWKEMTYKGGVKAEAIVSTRVFGKLVLQVEDVQIEDEVKRVVARDKVPGTFSRSHGSRRLPPSIAFAW